MLYHHCELSLTVVTYSVNIPQILTFTARFSYLVELFSLLTFHVKLELYINA